MHTEEELIKGCQKNDRKLQRELYERYADRMFVLCLRYTKSTQEAEDVLQESFIKVFDKIKDFKAESTLGYWIKRIVINTALNSQRSKLYLFPMVDVVDTNLSEREFNLSNIHFQELVGMIQQLPSGCQAVFNMYAIEGYKHQEIAKMLEISEGTSKSQYARAKLLLREMLEETDNVKYEKQS
jgi:RNA polymerase sigma-70 factor (ECF subfamily)